MNVYLVGAKNPETGRQLWAQRASDPTFEVKGFIDNDPAKHGGEFLGYPVLGGIDVVEDLVRSDPDARFVNLITGNTRTRYEVSRDLSLRGARFTNLIHPSVECDDVELGVGIYVQDGVLIQAGAKIGSNVSIHIAALVAHETIVGHSTFIAHAVSVSGEVSIGDGCFIGTNSTIVPRVSVGDWATIGAGSVVLRDVAATATAVGNPAKVIKQADVLEPSDDVFR